MLCVTLDRKEKKLTCRILIQSVYHPWVVVHWMFSHGSATQNIRVNHIATIAKVVGNVIIGKISYALVDGFSARCY